MVNFRFADIHEYELVHLARIHDYEYGQISVIILNTHDYWPYSCDALGSRGPAVRCVRIELAGVPRGRRRHTWLPGRRSARGAVGIHVGVPTAVVEHALIGGGLVDRRDSTVVAPSSGRSAPNRTPQRASPRLHLRAGVTPDDITSPASVPVNSRLAPDCSCHGLSSARCR